MLKILTYHRVAEAHTYPSLDPSLISASPEEFAWQMRYLARNFDVISLADLSEAMASGRRLPRKAVLITFDDAYRDFADVAWPEIKSCGLTATLFVATAYPDNPNAHFWWDRLHRAFSKPSVDSIEHDILGRLPLADAHQRRTSLARTIEAMKQLPHWRMLESVDSICRQLGSEESPDNGILGWASLERLSQEGVSLGAHTRSHPVLTQLSPDEICAEVAGSIADLKMRINHALPVFAYPGGFYNAEVEAILKREGILLAFTTQDGFNPLPLRQPLRLRRTNITPRTNRLVFRIRMTRIGAVLDRIRH